MTTEEFLVKRSSDAELLEQFWRPFLGGVFFDSNLDTSARMAWFVIRMFASGANMLPAEGMEVIPAAMVSRLPAGTVHLGARVVDREGSRLTLARGRATCRRLVLAMDGASFDRLERLPARRWRSSTTLWFTSPRRDVVGPWLHLDGCGPINHLAPVSEVAPSYAPSGGHLVAANVLGVPRADDATLARACRGQVERWLGRDLSHWRCLRVDRIPRSLPAYGVGAVAMAPRMEPGVYVAGDHASHPSLQGAIASGLRAAEACIADLRVRSHGGTP